MKSRQILAPQHLRADNSGGVINWLASAGPTLYLGTQSGLYALPLQGGALTRVSDDSDVHGVWNVGGRILFVVDGALMSVDDASSQPKKLGALKGFLSNLINPPRIAIDAENIYFSASDDAKTYSIRSLPLTGGEARTVVSVGAVMPKELTEDSGYLYFAQLGRISRVRVTGGTPSLVVDNGRTADLFRPIGLLATNGHVYFGRDEPPFPTMQVLNDGSDKATPFSRFSKARVVRDDEIHGIDLYKKLDGSFTIPTSTIIWGHSTKGTVDAIKACISPNESALALTVDHDNIYYATTGSDYQVSVYSTPR